MTYMTGPQIPGKVITDGSQDGDLEKLYRMGGGLYRWVKISGAISNAGGKVVVHSLTNGAITGTVVESTTLNDKLFAGVIPVAGDITAATTLADATRLLVQLSGEAVIRPANTTVVNSAALVISSTAGSVQSMTTGVEGALAVTAYIGYATNSAAASVTTVNITCVLCRNA